MGFLFRSALAVLWTHALFAYIPLNLFLTHQFGTCSPGLTFKSVRLCLDIVFISSYSISY